MKILLSCAVEDCECNHLVLEEVEVDGEKFLLRVRCNFCGAVMSFDLWTLWESQGGDA